MSGPYDDIIHLPHHVSTARPQMPIAKRAAQFVPFMALTSYDAAVKETARLTDRRIELDEDAIAELDMKLLLLADRAADHPAITVTYFLPDEKKEGGAYVTAIGALKKIDRYACEIVLMDGESIPIREILDIEYEPGGYGNLE